MSDRSRLRLVVLQVLVFSLLVTLLGRLWFLQVAAGQQYRAAAQNNVVREVITPPVRGLILDDQGRQLVNNRTTLVVTVDRSTLDKQKDGGVAVLTKLAKVLHTTYVDLHDRIQLCGTPGAKKPPICWNGSPFQPIPVAKDVTAEVALSIMERREDYPGVSTDLEALRDYPEPDGATAAHLLGYLGPVDPQEVASAKGSSSPLYGSEQVGRDGLEAVYDAQLRGSPGVKQLAVDFGGNVTGTLGETPAVPGNYLVTSIDAKVQAVAEQALKDRIMAARQGQTFERKKFAADSGAVVVMDVNTGRIVAMASYPTYDPNVWVGGISYKEYAALTSPTSGYPLVSRAIAGQFAPASTFKVVSTMAAVQEGFSLNATYPCTSSYAFANTSKRNYESEAYGPITIARAIEVSCNTVFYRLGYETWLKDEARAKPKESFVMDARASGYGSKTGIDLPGEMPGLVVSRADRKASWEQNKAIYCSRAKTGYPEVKDRAQAAYLKAIAAENCVDGWMYRGGDAVNVAIGQGDTLVTPLQVARLYSAIANGGTLYTPEVGRAIVTPEGKVVQQIQPKVAGRLPASASTIAYLQQALRGVALRGTGAGVFGPSYPVPVAAKTGSGTVAGKDDTSWFASYAPADHPKYAVVMMVSQGGTGAGTSGPGVKAIYDALFGVKGSTVDAKASILPNGVLPSALPPVSAYGQPSAPATPASLTTPTAPTSPTPVVGLAMALPPAQDMRRLTGGGP